MTPSCWYSLIKVAPDEVGGDTLSIGIVAVDDATGATAMRFVTDWSRAEAFLESEVPFAREFADALRRNEPPVTLEQMREWSRDFQNALRVTWPSEASVTVDQWVREFGDLFVRGLEAA